MWLIALIAGVPGALVGGFAWMAVLALYGAVTPLWMLGFLPALGLIWCWRVLNNSSGSGAAGFALLVVFATIGSIIGLIGTAVFTLGSGV